MSKNWAICIGINEYKYVGKLNYAQADAEKMRDFCRDELHFDEVFYFAEAAPDVALKSGDGRSLEASPSFGNLDMFLDIQFRQGGFLNPQDSLWFFFAGHGMRSDGIDYLLPIDGNASRLDRTGLEIHYVAERLRRCGAGNIVLMLDACRDGDARGAEGIGGNPEQGVVTICSCGPNEQAYEEASLGQGVFTYALLEGLRLAGDRNCATVDRLSHWLKQRVVELNQTYGKNRRQTPIVRAEPVHKLHWVLLPDKATVHDAAPLREEAVTAELNGDLALARQLWINVLAIVRADLKAIQGLERIAVKQAIASPTAQTLNLMGEGKSLPVLSQFVKP